MHHLLADLPEIEAFPTVAEMSDFATTLAARFPERVTISEVGRSRQGIPIQLLSIQATEPTLSVLIVGQPHPNEPIGMATITVLCDRLLADTAALDEIGASWHFVPVADPDGTLLNEGWFSGPWNRAHYARHFYRPGGAQQVEWTFPFATADFVVDAPMPETEALMAAIDSVKPAVIASLHNGEMGGAYFYADAGAPELYRTLTDLCDANEIPLHRGGPEAPFIKELAPAVFAVPTAQQMYDMALQYGIDPTTIVSGGSSLEYASQYGAVGGVVIELPYWRDDRAGDVAPLASGATRREVTIEALDRESAAVLALRSILDRAAPVPSSPFSEAVEAFVSMVEAGYMDATRAEAESDPSYEDVATVAEAFAAMDTCHMFRLRTAGMLLRALPTTSDLYAEATGLFEQWCAEEEAESASEPIPIRDLVAVQAGAILATVLHTVAK